MTNKNNEKLDQLIYKSIKIDDKPTKKLNDSLKAQLYEKENTEKAKIRIKVKYFMYLFMILSAILSIFIGFLASIFIRNIYLYMAVLILILSYSLSGIILTIIGFKIKNVKEIII